MSDLTERSLKRGLENHKGPINTPFQALAVFVDGCMLCFSFQPCSTEDNDTKFAFESAADGENPDAEVRYYTSPESSNKFKVLVTPGDGSTVVVTISSHSEGTDVQSRIRTDHKLFFDSSKFPVEFLGDKSKQAEELDPVMLQPKSRLNDFLTTFCNDIVTKIKDPNAVALDQVKQLFPGFAGGASSSQQQTRDKQQSEQIQQSQQSEHTQEYQREEAQDRQTEALYSDAGASLLQQHQPPQARAKPPSPNIYGVPRDPFQSFSPSSARVPAPGEQPPGWDDELDINRLRNPSDKQKQPARHHPFSIGHDDLHPPSLRDPFSPTGTGGGGMYVDFNSPLFDGRGGTGRGGGGGQFAPGHPHMPPGARYDPINPSDNPMDPGDPSGNLEGFPGPGRRGGGSGGNPFGGGAGPFGGNDGRFGGFGGDII